MTGNNYNILPFFDRLELQNKKQHWGAEEFFIICPDNRLLPFQIIRESSNNDNITVLIKKLNGQTYRDVTGLIDITVKHLSEYDVIINYGIIPFADKLIKGKYYCELSDGVNTWYSEIFNTQEQEDINNKYNIIKLTYWNENGNNLVFGKVGNTREIVFDERFKFECYIQAKIGKPIYEYEEEVTTRNMIKFFEKQVLCKRFRFSFPTIESFADAIHVSRICENIQITYLNEEYEIIDFIPSISWQDKGDICRCDVEFMINNVYSVIGNLKEPIDYDRGDFNGDFNNDFDNRKYNI